MELYPELEDYIFEYCQQFFNEDERLANHHRIGVVKLGTYERESAREKWLKERFMTDKPEALALLKNGFDHFRSVTAERIFREHQHELVLNFCPACGKIARTPQARQCRFCSHDWH